MQLKRSNRRISLCLPLASAVVLLFFTALAAPADDNAIGAAPVALDGSVWDDESNPITNATIFLYTARPRKGVSSICPSCYPDCQKSARTDAEGKFKIEQLDSSLLFNLLVTAQGYEPAFVDKVDIGAGPAEIGLQKTEPWDPAATKQVQGRIIDSSGKPVFGAKIEADSLTQNNGTRWGRIRGTARFAVTDEKGQFAIRTSEPFDSLGIKIEARGLARLRKNGLVADKSHFIKMKKGASIAGRVLQDGKPVKNIAITATDHSSRRWSPDSLGEFEIGTDAEGRFRLVNLPADTEYSIYGKMKALQALGAISGRPIRSGTDGSVVDAGDLNVEPGHRLAGFVTVAGDEPVLPGIKMNISREDTGDNLSVILDDDGAFDVRGIPEESVSIHVRMPGYRLAAKNPNLDRLNPWRLMGRVDRDLLDFQILFEQGKDYQQGDAALSNLPGPDQPSDVPLRGVVPVKTQ